MARKKPDEKSGVRYTKKYDRVCFVCGRKMEPVDPPGSKDSIPFMAPLLGTMWESAGNYGSTVWDSFGMETDSLHIVICDNCLKAGAERVYHFTLERQPPKIKFGKGIEGVGKELVCYGERSDELGYRGT